MKKIISLIITLIMLLSIGTNAYAAAFTDFAADHWAFGYVDELAADGTINGFTDGTFRPTGVVSRAEFVKMIGNGPEVRENAFDDVAADHWAYSYIMSSGLEAKHGNSFEPSAPITRGEVADLLWKRVGSPKGITAPPVVHRQNGVPDALSWAYTNGIMVGSDYIDLRLADTLTRAEAAALIVRSRKISSSTEKVDFMTSIDQDLFEIAYNAFKLTDRPYSADATVTNGELAMMAARLMCSDDFPTYQGVTAQITFEHTYAQPLNMLCRYYLGFENDNAEYADKAATLGDAIAAFTFTVQKASGVSVPNITDATYPGYKSSGNAEYDKLISGAYANGIWFTSPEEMDFEKQITMKELACLAIEYDGFMGFHRSSLITHEGITPKHEKIRTDVKLYPSNADEYRIILASHPNSIYTTPFRSVKVGPGKQFSSANSFQTVFTSMFDTWVKALKEAGYELQVIYYPSLVVNNSNGYTMRVCIKFVDIPANTKLGDLIICTKEADGSLLVSSGDMIYADVETGAKLTGAVTGIENMLLDQIIY